MVLIEMFNEWRRKVALKEELRAEFRYNDEADCIGMDYLPGADYETVHASLEKKYLALGLSEAEIKKVYKNRGPIVISG